jgi:hypothetical protein
VILASISIVLTGCAKPINNNQLSTETSNQIDVTSEKVIEYLGEYVKNSTKLPIVDSVHTWFEETNKSRIIQTPSLLTSDEKSRLRSGENPFLVLTNKETPNEKVWQWYPYVLTEITFKSMEINKDNIRWFYIYASGLEEEIDTTNISGYPSSEYIFTKVELIGENLRIRYSGSVMIFEDKHTWDINI